MQITMIGCGYVGLVSGSCLAEVGHEVICVDHDRQKVETLKNGRSPIYELGLEGLIKKNSTNKRLRFTSDLKHALSESEVVFIAVGTPQGKDGRAELKNVRDAARSIGQLATRPLSVVVKSTVPVGTCAEVERLIHQELEKRQLDWQFPVVSNPEFLKEGVAVADFMKPERIVIGLKDDRAKEQMTDMYSAFMVDDPFKLLFVERSASEMIKYVANTMLATRVSFMNELSQLCEKVGVNIDEVRHGVGLDSRIGRKYLHAGPGYGGSCLPKDVEALLTISDDNDVNFSILRAVRDANQRQKEFAAAKILCHFESLEGRTIGIWGLSFKPNTDDVRESPAQTVISKLIEWGAQVKVHDPKAMETFRQDFGEHPSVSYHSSSEEVCEGVDALCVVTDWSAYKWPHWESIGASMKEKVVFDFRNIYQKKQMDELGFKHISIGRG